MDINPYAPATPVPPAPIAIAPAERPLWFDGVVRHVDVARVGYNRTGIVIAAVLLIIGSLTCAFTGFGLAMAVVTSAVALEIASSVVALSLMVLLLVLPPLWLLARFRGEPYARLLQKWSPRVVGPVSGKFEQETLEVVYPHSRTVIPLQSLTGVRTTEQFIALASDHRQMQVTVLPRHLFADDDFDLAVAQLSPLAAQRPLTIGTRLPLDARLWEGEPLELIARPRGAAAFSGTLEFRDFTSTRVYREQLQTVYRSFAKLAAIALGALLLIAGVFWDEREFAFRLLAVVSAILAFLFVWLVVAWKRQMPRPEQPIANISGWLSEQGLIYNSAIGSSLFQPHAFERVDADQHSLQLILPGQFKQAVLLNERMFSSAEDFQQVRRWAGVAA